MYIVLLFAFVQVIYTENCPSYPLPIALPDPLPSSIVNVLKDVDTFLSNQQKQMKLPGLICSVVYDQNIIFSGAYGYNNPFNTSEGPPTIDSGIRIASITKLFTDIMLMYLRDQGLVSLDDAVVKYLPKFSVKNPYKTNRPITLRQVASHTSGVQREVPCDWYKLDVCTEDEILANLSRTYLLFPQYSTPHYSNLGISLLGRALEKVAKIPYETYVENNILKPLNMANSTFNYDKIKAQMATGTDVTSNGTVVPAHILDLGWGNPMGGLFSTVRDMSKFISFMFRNDIIAGATQVLDGSTINEVLRPIILDTDGYSGFGTPWEFKYIQDYWLKSKAGSLVGYRSQVAIVPPIKLGVFCVDTSGTDDSTNSILTEPLMNMLLPVFTQVLWSLQPKVPLPPNANLFTGLYLYSNAYDGNSYFEVYITEQVMYAAFTDLVNPFSAMNLTQYDETTFRVRDQVLQECRWLNDGTDEEFIYFTMDSSKSFATSLSFMATQFNFVSKNCPQCK